MIILVGCNKGGSGKTTTATNISVGLAMRGADVCLVDADKQASSERWAKERDSSEIEPSITLVQKLDNTSNMIKKLNGKFDYIIVDVAGHNSREMITAAMIADIVIAPHQASQLDLDTLEELQEQVVKIMDYNKKLQVYIYHAMASTNPKVKDIEREDFEKYVSELKEFTALNAVGYFRKEYRDVISLGKSVLETDNANAANEIQALIDEVLERAKTPKVTAHNEETEEVS